MDNGGLHGMQVIQPTCNVKQLRKASHHALLISLGQDDVPGANVTRADSGISIRSNSRSSSTEKPHRFSVSRDPQRWRRRKMEGSSCGVRFSIRQPPGKNPGYIKTSANRSIVQKSVLPANDRQLSGLLSAVPLKQQLSRITCHNALRQGYLGRQYYRLDRHR